VLDEPDFIAGAHGTDLLSRMGSPTSPPQAGGLTVET
jgi:hypothetical protein